MVTPVPAVRQARNRMRRSLYAVMSLGVVAGAVAVLGAPAKWY